MKNVKFDVEGYQPEWSLEVEFKNDLNEDIVDDLLNNYYDEIVDFEEEDEWFTIGDEEVRITSYWSTHTNDDSWDRNIQGWEEAQA